VTFIMEMVEEFVVELFEVIPSLMPRLGRILVLARRVSLIAKENSHVVFWFGSGSVYFLCKISDNRICESDYPRHTLYYIHKWLRRANVST